MDAAVFIARYTNLSWAASKAFANYWRKVELEDEIDLELKIELVRDQYAEMEYEEAFEVFIPDFKEDEFDKKYEDEYFDLGNGEWEREDTDLPICTHYKSPLTIKKIRALEDFFAENKIHYILFSKGVLVDKCAYDEYC